MKKIDVVLSKDHRLCECSPECMKQATQHHHLFPNTKVNRKIYGKLIDHDKNVKFVNHDCHSELINYHERLFCALVGVELRSKVLKGKGNF